MIDEPLATRPCSDRAVPAALAGHGSAVVINIKSHGGVGLLPGQRALRLQLAAPRRA